MVENNQTIEFRELLAFSTVVNTGGITAAADRLGLSKSTVSLQISRLETRLGLRLLERNSRRVALTREGERLLPRVASLLEEVQLLVDDSAQAASVPGGEVRIAVTPAFGSVVLKHLAPRLRRTHPNLRLVVQSSYSFDDLQDPSFDFGIRVAKNNDENLVAQRIGSFRRILVASPDLIGDKPPERPEDLARLPCLVFSGSSSNTNWRLVSKTHPEREETVPVQAHIAVKSFSSLVDLAKDGLGVASVTNFLVHEELASGRLVRVLPDWHSPDVDVLLVYRFGASKVARVAAALAETRIVVAEILAADGD